MKCYRVWFVFSDETDEYHSKDAWRAMLVDAENANNASDAAAQNGRDRWQEEIHICSVECLDKD